MVDEAKVENSKKERQSNIKRHKSYRKRHIEQEQKKETYRTKANERDTKETEQK